jgi:hypothetical protein
MAAWQKLETINDNEKYYAGTTFLLLPIETGIKSRLSAIPKEGLYYLMAESRSNHRVFELVCLSMGEQGNVSSVIDKEEHSHYVTGKELKRMLLTDLHRTFICQDPEIKIL